MTAAVLSLGSNLGDRFAHLRAAVAGFADVLVAASPVYETAPWGGVAQDDFLNAVLLVAATRPSTRGAGCGAGRRWRTRPDGSATCGGARGRSTSTSSRVDDVRSTDPELLLPHPGTPGARHRAAAVAGRRPRTRCCPATAPSPSLLAALGPDAERGMRRRDDLVLAP